MREAVIVSAVRTAVGKAKRGTLVDVRPDDMAAAVIREALRRAPGIEAGEVEDVILGCSFPEGEQGMNVARIALLRAGLPVTVPGQTVNRSCASGLQSIAMAAERIRAGWGTCMIAGGTESMSMVPMNGHSYAPNPWLLAHHPQVYLSMGETAEQVASTPERIPAVGEAPAVPGAPPAARMRPTVRREMTATMVPTAPIA